MTQRRRVVLMLFASGLVSVGSGCAGRDAEPRMSADATPTPADTRVASAQAEADDPMPTQSSAALIAWIGRQPFVTAEAGYRIAHVIWAGKMFDGDYAELEAALEAGRVIDGVWEFAPDRPLNRGDVGYIICRAYNIRTGFWWNVLGLGRYAYRELQFHRIAGPGGEFGLPSGGEFQGIIRAADNWLADSGRMEAWRAELGERR